MRWKVTARLLAAQGATLEELAALWRAWSDQDRSNRQSVTWADVKTNVVVKQVASPDSSDP